MVINFFTFVILTLLFGLLNGDKDNSTTQYKYAGSFTAVAGRGFSRTYPRHIFIDSEWGHREIYKVYLRTKDNKKLFSNSWISIDPTGQKIIGFPMEGNQGEFTFLLCAQNNRREMKIRRIKVDVLVDQFITTHTVMMKLTRGFRSFIVSLSHRILFVSALAEYLRENGIKASMRDIWITSIKPHNYTISWTLSTHNKNSCSEILTEKLPQILSIGGKPKPELVRKLNPHFGLSFVSMVISKNCLRPGSKDILKEEKNLIIGPVLIIIIMIGLSSPIFFAYLIRRGIRKREFRRAGDVRHIFTNGAATPIFIDQEKASDTSRSAENISNRMQYRWSPDMTNRVQVHIPRLPPPRPMLSQGGSLYSSMESTKSSAWHGLPTNQCTENDGLPLVSIVQSIGQSASTLKSLFVASMERESENETLATNGVEDDCFSIKSEGNRIIESALKKVSTFINNSYFSAPTLIRVSKSDLDEDSIITRKSSLETRNSSFECSVLSSDLPTPSQISSGVNSFDTEAFLTTSLSQDESFTDDGITAQTAKEELAISERQKTDGEDFGRNGPVQKCLVSQNSSTSENGSTTDKDQDNANSPQPLRKTSIRGSLQRLPTIQAPEGDALEDDKNSTSKSDLLHPWYRDQANVRVQQNKRGMTSQYYIAKTPKNDKGNPRKPLHEEIIYEICYDEGVEPGVLV